MGNATIQQPAHWPLCPTPQTGLCPSRHQMDVDANYSPSSSSMFSPLIQQQVMQFTPACRRVHITPTERLQPVDDTKSSNWKLCACTANVLATEVWNLQPVGTKRTGQRTVRLDAQWHHAQYHVVGVQEARTAQGRFHAPHYHIFSSGAKHKRAPLYGCELWIHKTLPVATDPEGKPVVLGRATFTVQHADPRRLFVEARLGTTTYAL